MNRFHGSIELTLEFASMQDSLIEVFVMQEQQELIAEFIEQMALVAEREAEQKVLHANSEMPAEKSVKIHEEKNTILDATINKIQESIVAINKEINTIKTNWGGDIREAGHPAQVEKLVANFAATLPPELDYENKSHSERAFIDAERKIAQQQLAEVLNNTPSPEAVAKRVERSIAAAAAANSPDEVVPKPESITPPPEYRNKHATLMANIKAFDVGKSFLRKTGAKHSIADVKNFAGNINAQIEEYGKSVAEYSKLKELAEQKAKLDAAMDDLAAKKESNQEKIAELSPQLPQARK